MHFPDVDKRLAKWPFMANATETVLIVLVYLLFVKVIGPAWMKNREPFHLRLPMIFHNFALVIFCSWMFYKFGKHGWFSKYSWICQPVDYSEDEDAMGMVEVCWYFYISKIIELADTVFLVLRKKDSQISRLHVIHHATVPLSAYLAISRGAGGYNIFFGFLNSFAHIWMYLYYGLAAVGPSTHKYLWWKKYLTTLQMVQFCIVVIVLIVHILHPSCEVNPALIMISLGNAVFFFVLFMHFYITSYRKKPKTDLSLRNGSRTEDTVTQLENGNKPHVRHRSYIGIINGSDK